MIVEYIRYTLPEDRVEPFHQAYREVGKYLTGDVHCQGWEMRQSIENTGCHVVRIEWDSIEGHVDGFRSSQGFAAFFGRLKEFAAFRDEMSHYEVVTAVDGEGAAT